MNRSRHKVNRRGAAGAPASTWRHGALKRLPIASAVSAALAGVPVAHAQENKQGGALEEVVVTGYTEQRRGDITGGVSTVNVEATQRQSGASVLQRLDAAVPGVTVVNSGSPGSRSTVRIEANPSLRK